MWEIVKRFAYGNCVSSERNDVLLGSVPEADVSTKHPLDRPKFI